VIRRLVEPGLLNYKFLDSMQQKGTLIRRVMSGIFLGLALMSSPAEAGDTSNETPPAKPHLLRRIAPVGGWDPDGLGMFHWWKPNCFGLNRNPDDYCRKPIPRPFCPPRPPAGGHQNFLHH
jgi:hypothetical protein